MDEARAHLKTRAAPSTRPSRCCMSGSDRPQAAASAALALKLGRPSDFKATPTSSLSVRAGVGWGGVGGWVDGGVCVWVGGGGVGGMYNRSRAP